jgi:L-fuculose-phosphate aldolase
MPAFFSATSEELLPLTLDGSRFATRVPHHKDTAELVNTVELGQGLADALGEAYAVFMLNHGITFVGRTIDQALLMGLSVERACQAQLAAAASGLKMEWPSEEAMAALRRSGTGNETHAPQGFYRQTFDYYARKLAWAGRTAPMPGFYRL